MLEITGSKHKILSVDPNPESGAIDQARMVADLPFVVGHVGLMAGVHQGYGFPIECVAAFDGVVSPNAVGNDIGCGMVTQKLHLSKAEIWSHLETIGSEILKAIPVGPKSRAQGIPSILDRMDISTLGIISADNEKTIITQIATLGSGNHFIEIQYDDYDESVWVMIHSGSRHLGAVVKDHYHGVAVSHMQKWHTGVPKDLAFLPVGNSFYPELGDDYLQDHNTCIRFAHFNRYMMMDIVTNLICFALDRDIPHDDTIETCHNYASIENMFGGNYWIHRKGAVQARKGTVVTIPGSMSTYSVIGVGKGNPATLYSCSHGAGRAMPRKLAKKTFTVGQMEADMEARKILLCTPDHTTVLDEWGPAYKDLTNVMKWQADIVDIKHKLFPMLVVKG